MVDSVGEISELLTIANRIGQGDLLSMLLYILYNADLLELPDNPTEEDALGYVDDIALIASGTDFEETTQRLSNMMTKNEGGLQWSINHNSHFEVTKSAIIHFPGKQPRTQIRNMVESLYTNPCLHWKARLFRRLKVTSTSAFKSTPTYTGENKPKEPSPMQQSGFYNSDDSPNLPSE
jgi:hypothetical protein